MSLCIVETELEPFFGNFHARVLTTTESRMNRSELLLERLSESTGNGIRHSVRDETLETSALEFQPLLRARLNRSDREMFATEMPWIIENSKPWSST